MEVNNELYHHGIKGQKWHVRRYQNMDGTLTAAGKRRYASLKKAASKYDRQISKYDARKIRHKKKIPYHYFTDFGQAATERHMRRASANEAKSARAMDKLFDTEKKLSEITEPIFSSNLSDKEYQRLMKYYSKKLSSVKKGGNHMSHSEFDAHAFIEMQSDELFHHGIKGQKWGVRRFQNPDGTLTPAGRKRRAKYEAKIDKRTKKLKAKMDEEGLNTKEERPKTLSELSIEELNEAVTRARLEAQLYNEQFNRATSISRLKEAQKSKGRKFIEDYAPKLMDQVVIPVAKDKLDKSTDALLRRAGLDLSSPIEKLQREATMSKLRADIADNNKRARDANKAPSALDDLKRQADEARYLADIADSNKRANEARNGNPLANLKLKADEARYLADIADSNNRARKANAVPDITEKEARALAKKKYDVDLADLESKLKRAQTQLANNGYDPKGSNKGYDLSDPNEVQKLIDAFRKAGVSI